ncbi:MAG: hypothetical protein IPP18_00195 [Rhodocyclaceae bacterium]|nr:hypothetical protein [Rhodocyclaceae bacterium]
MISSVSNEPSARRASRTSSETGRETAALLTGARGLDGGVERQQVVWSAMSS